MYKLYWYERTGAFAPAAVMAELGIPYEAIHLAGGNQNAPEFLARNLSGGAQNTPEFLALNPMAQVPILILPDGGSMTESGAIALYLAETKPESGLAPLPGDPIRPQFLRWLSFAQINIYETVLRYFYSERYTSEASGAAGVHQAAAERLERLWDMIAGKIQGPFFFGARFTVLDIYLAMLSAWHSDPPALYKRLPKLGALVEATVSRPAAGKVWTDYSLDKR